MRGLKTIFRASVKAARQAHNLQDYVQFVGSGPNLAWKCWISNLAVGISLLTAVFLFGCASNETQTGHNARWLTTSQQMLSVGDPAISTTDPQKVLLLVEWAATNGYTVQVSQRDPVAGERKGMYFMVVSKQ